MSGNLLIFAGAGASKAVNSGKFPTTVEFFDQIPDSIRSFQLFKDTVDFLGRVRGIDPIDIEEVLWNLQELMEYCEQYAEAKGLPGYLLQTGRLAALAGIGLHGSADKTLREGLLQSRQLMSEINSVVYSAYDYEPEESELENNWLPLIRESFSRFSRVDIVTTNYDTVIESALAYALPDRAQKIMGLKGAVRKQVDVPIWSKPDASSGLLTKLHGSIDWQVKDGKVYLASPFYTGNHGNQAIIYPGFKGKNTPDYLSVMHDYFASRIEETDAIIFIGFAFRDEYINDLLRNVPRKTRVVVINPAKPSNLPKRGKVSHLAVGFDKQSVMQAITSL